LSGRADRPVPHTLAITWEQHRRTRELCDWLGLPLHEVTFSAARLKRYAKLSAQTLRLLAQRRPKVLYVQNPSLILATLVLAARPFLGRYKVIMDAHNEAVAPFTHAYWPVTSLSRHALRAADITIVTNAALADQVRRIGGTPHILPDRLPTPPFTPTAPPVLNGPLRVMVVATYAADEPIAEIIEAARALGDQYQLSITGRETKLPAEQRARLPSNVRQTGFLAEEAYWELMRDSHIVLDLTLKPNCLVCGAYESLAVLRPMVLTGNPATVDLFGKVAVFPAEHDAKSIAECLQRSRAQLAQLNDSVVNERPRFEQRWLEHAVKLREKIAGWI
jgi:hypothetical protein